MSALSVARETGWRSALADARLDREYHARHRDLVWFARRRFRLPVEDCEELANEALLAWHRRLKREGVANDDAFCMKVVRYEAITRLVKRALPTVELDGLVELLGTDPELDLQLIERDEASRLCGDVRRLLNDRERKVLLLQAYGHERGEIASLLGLRERQVKSALAVGRSKLAQIRIAHQARERRLTQTIARP
jgi:RNA polymerase sigma factor (sigma-70 family)